jgi:GTP-binding protein YchF
MDVALIGLASAGKTSLMQALAAGHLPAHSNPLEPAMAVVKVPDERLDRLATLVEAKKTTYLELKILDFPSFAVGKKGPPPALLGTLATADMVVHVVHAFDSPAVPHPLDSVDPARDIAAMDMELAFADLAIVERRIERLTAEMRSMAAGQRANQEREVALMTRIRQALENETPVRAMGLTAEEMASLAGFNLVSAKPLLIVLNIAEVDAPRTDEIEAEARDVYAGRNTAVIALCARSEADVAELPPDEAAMFREELGLPEKTAPERVLQAAVSLLGLITFYTAGQQDTHAWSIPAGLPATRAAGRIHTDIERGFIRAEVIGWQELLDAGSHAEAKRRGTMRVEGKTYEVQDGDVINVLFNV